MTKSRPFIWCDKKYCCQRRAFLGLLPWHGSFSLWCRKGVKCYVNAHLHCIISSLKWASKISTLPINGKISVNAYACVVYVYNVTSTLYNAINNRFCVIRVSFVATSLLACRWMCDSPRTGCAWRHTPTYMWREQAKTKAHTYEMYMIF